MWIALGIISGAVSLFAIPYGFHLKASEQESLTENDNHNHEIGSDESPNILERNENNSFSDKNIYDAIYTQYSVAMKIPGSITKTEALKTVTYEATDNSYFELAFEIAKEIPGTITRTESLSYLALKAASAGRLKDAAKYAEAIPGKTTKTSTLQKISMM